MGSSVRKNGGERAAPGILSLLRSPPARPGEKMAAVSSGVDMGAFRDVCGRFVTGVGVITSFGQDGPSGMTANAVSSLSLEPPLMIVCFDRTARTLGAVRHTRRFGVHFLGHSQEELAARFASKRPEAEKFAEVPWSERSGVPLLEGCLAGLACELRELVEGGDHLIGIGEVVDLWSSGDGDAPLVFFRGDYWSLSGSEPAPPDVDAALEP
jgi:flavin reductase (DIM6/NTAB) family NADH-FMN oxidoreductase RutF